MTRLGKGRNLVLNGGLLTAVLLITLAPLFDVNPAALTAVHSHLFLGNIEQRVGHEHHAQIHSSRHNQARELNPLEVMQRIEAAIVLLPDHSISQLGYLYFALLALFDATMVAPVARQLVQQTNALLPVYLYTASPLDKPPVA